MADTNIVQVIIRAIDETKGGFTQTIRGASDVETAFNKLKPAAAAAAVAVALAFGAITKSAIDSADETSKAAQKATITAESYSTLAYAAGLADVQSEKLTTSLSKLNRQISDAAVKGGEIRRSFDGIGVSVVGANGKMRQADDVLLDLADAFAAMEDGPRKGGLAMEFFGKSGADMLPFLNAGRAGIEELREEARAFGQEISSNTGVAAENFNDNLTRLGAVSRGYGNYLAEQFLPILNSLTDGMVANIRESGLFVDVINAALGPVKVMASGVLMLAEGFNIWGGAAGTLAAVIEQLFRGNFSGAAAAWNEYALGVGDSIETLKIRLADLWVPDGAAVSSARKGGRELAENFVTAAGDTLQQEQAKLAAVMAQTFTNSAGFTKTISDSLLRQSEVELDQGKITLEQFYAIKANLAQQSAKAEIDALDLVAQARERKLATLDVGTPEYEAEAAGMQKAIQDRMAAEKAAAVEQEVIDNERRNRLADIHIAEMDAIAARSQAEEEAWQQRNDRERENYEMVRDLVTQLEAEKLQARYDLAGSDGETMTGRDSEAIAAYYEQMRLLEDADLQARLRAIAERDLAEEESLAMSEQAYEAHLLRKRKMDADEDKAKKRLRQQELGLASDFFGNLAEVAKAFGKKGFAAYKAFATAQAVIATYSSAVKAYDSLAGIPFVGPALGAAAAAAAIAFGIARVQQIQSAQPGGAAHGGLTYVPQETTYLLQQGERVLSPNQNSDLIRFMQEQNRPTASQGEMAINLGGREIGRVMYEMSRDGELKIDSRAVR